MMLLPLLGAATFQRCQVYDPPKSLISNLQILAVINDPSELLPGEDFESTLVLVDPSESKGSFDYVVVACTTLDEQSPYVVGCLEEVALVRWEDYENGSLTLDEDEYRQFIEDFVRYGSVSSRGLVTEIDLDDTIEVSNNFSFLMDAYGYDFYDLELEVLACESGLCPIVEEIDAYMHFRSEALSGEELFWKIASLESLAAGAPTDSVSLARKEYRLNAHFYGGDDDYRNNNPTFELFQSAGACQITVSSDGNSQYTCPLEAQLTAGSLEVYVPPSGYSNTTEGMIIRFFSTQGELVPYYGQLDYSENLTVSTSLVLDNEHAPDSPVPIFSVAVDSRGGMGYIQSWSE